MSFLVIFVAGALCAAGIAYAIHQGMELLGRLAAVVGISLVLTLLLLVLYQDDSAQAMEPQSVSISQQVAGEPVVATP